jgi:hypothetical protein
MTTTDASTLIGNLSIYAETVTVGTHTVEVEGVINQDSMVFRPVQVASETYPLISYSKGAGMENKVDDLLLNNVASKGFVIIAHQSGLGAERYSPD